MDGCVERSADCGFKHSGDAKLIWIPNQKKLMHLSHAAPIASDGHFKVLAIKLPPQQAGDMHMEP